MARLFSLHPKLFPGPYGQSFKTEVHLDCFLEPAEAPKVLNSLHIQIFAHSTSVVFFSLG